MSDTPMADDWWAASDGKYYPPESHPDYVPPAPSAAPVAPEATQPAPPPMPAPPGTAPAGPPTEYPPAAAAAAGPPMNDPTEKTGFQKYWWAPVLAGVAALGVVLALTLGGSDDEEPVATADATPTAEIETPTVEPETDPEPTATTEPAEEDPTAQPEDPTPEPEEDPTPDPDSGDLDPVDVTPENAARLTGPAGLGEMFGNGEWHFTVLEIVDADEAGLIASYTDDIADDEANVAIIYEITYVGSELSAYNPLRLQAITPSGTFDAFLGCYLDDQALAEIDIGYSAELVPGQTSRQADCAVVPADEISELVVEVEHDFRLELAHFSANGGKLPPLNDPGIVPGPPNVDTVALGTVVKWDEWDSAIVAIDDASKANFISDFAEPPADGYTYYVVYYDVTNTGDDGEFDPIIISALGQALYNSFGDCFLDFDAVEDAGLADPFDDVPIGDTKSTALCIALPTAELNDVVFRMDNYSDFDADAVFYKANS